MSIVVDCNTAFPHVNLRSGVAYVVGSGTPVYRLFDWHRKGVTAEALVRRYPTLGPAKVLSALAYAYDNAEQMAKDAAHFGRELFDAS